MKDDGHTILQLLEADVFVGFRVRLWSTNGSLQLNDNVMYMIYKGDVIMKDGRGGGKSHGESEGWQTQRPGTPLSGD